MIISFVSNYQQYKIQIIMCEYLFIYFDQKGAG